MSEGYDLFWQISGPRKYLNIPSPVPDRWRAELTSWSRDLTVIGWGRTEEDAREAALRQITESDRLKAAVSESVEIIDRKSVNLGNFTLTTTFGTIK